MRWAVRGTLLTAAGVLVLAAAVSAKPFLAILREMDTVESFETYPPLLVSALLAAEDQDFLTAGRFRSVSGVLSAKSPSLTTHLVRSLLQRHHERAVITEALVYIEVELSQPRERILSAYLGKVPLAVTPEGPIEGFKAAALHYAGKEVQALSPAECALLAGLVKGPSYYSPARNPERARERRNMVLERLHESGAINEAQLQEAVASPIPNWGPTSGSSGRSALRAARR